MFDFFLFLNSFSINIQEFEIYLTSSIKMYVEIVHQFIVAISMDDPIYSKF